jgi:hypothetical protein
MKGQQFLQHLDEKGYDGSLSLHVRFLQQMWKLELSGGSSRVDGARHGWLPFPSWWGLFGLLAPSGMSPPHLCVVLHITGVAVPARGPGGHHHTCVYVYRVLPQWLER